MYGWREKSSRGFFQPLLHWLLSARFLDPPQAIEDFGISLLHQGSIRCDDYNIRLSQTLDLLFSFGGQADQGAPPIIGVSFLHHQAALAQKASPIYHGRMRLADQCRVSIAPSSEFAALSAELERAYSAALTLLQHTDAMLIDLRQNGGGHGSAAHLLAGSFFAAPVHFLDTYDRPTNRRIEGWTPAVVPGPRRPDVPLYVITSGGTYSAAEAMSFGLQALQRAVIVGETTGGGAHPTEYKAVTSSIVLALPESRSEHPITRKNWQDVGVRPDVAVAADVALERAHLLALERLTSSATSTTRRAELEWDVEYIRSKATPATISADMLRSLAGRYGLRTLSYEPPSQAERVDQGALYYQLEGRPRFQLHPVAADTTTIRFVLSESDRVELTRNGQGTWEMRKFDRSGQSVAATRSSATP
jgi:hypothetical protein